MPLSRSRRTVPTMSSVRSAMCWQPGERYQSRYSWIWLFFLPRGRLVDRELDPAVAVGHDLRHQRRVLGVDDLVVVVDELGEARARRDRSRRTRPSAPSSTLPTQWSTSSSDSPPAAVRGRLDLAIAGREGAARSRDRSTNEWRTSPYVRIDALRSVPSSPPSSSVGLERRDRATGRRLAPGRLHVVDREGDVVDAVAVGADVLGDLAVRRQRGGEHEPDVVLDHDVARPVADLGLEAAERDRGEAPQGAVVGARPGGRCRPRTRRGRCP